MLFRGLSASRGYKTHTYLGLEIQSALSLALWSSAQSFWLQIQRSRVRFPALPDFSE